MPDVLYTPLPKCLILVLPFAPALQEGRRAILFHQSICLAETKRSTFRQRGSALR